MSKQNNFKLETVKLDNLVVDRGTQFRTGLSEDNIERLEILYRDPDMRDQVDPLDVWRVLDAATQQEVMVLTGGFHRRAGALRAGVNELPARVFEGSMDDALFDALKQNAKHGKQLTYGDMRKKVLWALDNTDKIKDRLKADKISNRAIAQVLGCSHTLVNNIKTEIKNEKAEARAAKANGSMTMDQHLHVERNGDEVTTDEAGLPLDDKGKEIFTIIGIRDEIGQHLRAVRELIKRAAEHPGGYALVGVVGEVGEDGDYLEGCLVARKRGESTVHVHPKLEQAWDEFRAGIPYASICPYCYEAGKVSSKCKHCKGTNALTKFSWDQCPAELRQKAVKEAEARLAR